MKNKFGSRVIIITAIFTTFSVILKEFFIKLNDPLTDQYFYPFVFLVSVTFSFLISVWLDKRITRVKENQEIENYRKSVLRYGVVMFVCGIIVFIGLFFMYQLKTNSWNKFDPERPIVLEGTLSGSVVDAIKKNKEQLPIDGSEHYQVYLKYASTLNTIEEIYGRFYSKDSIIILRLEFMLLYLVMTFAFCSTIYMVLEYLFRFSKKPVKIGRKKLSKINPMDEKNKQKTIN